jgi:TonB-like protein
MRSNKANIAGLTSPRQQSEMKSILAGTWPPLMPLPVFKYETVEYRATIDFDKKRGEWVCRKTSLPSNKVQELRGGLREITMALPHGEEEVLLEGAEQQEQEFEKDTNRRLQAIHDWRDNYKNGARYFELRDFLSESQRTELDDSLRLSLTARQLQFNSKNVANVFDDLSIAGGRFATLIEFAKRNKTNQGTDPQAKGEAVAPEAECTIDHDEQALAVSSRELGLVPNNNGNSSDLDVRDQEPAERCADAEEFPALSIKDVFPEQEQAPLAERPAHIPSQPFESETSEVVDAGSQSLVEPPHQEGPRSPAFTGFAAQVRPDPSSAARIEGLFSRFPALEISTFQVAVFASLFLLAVIAFNVGLKVGRSPLGRRLREAPKSLLAVDAKPPTLPDRADESTSRTPPPPPVASSDDSAGAKRLDDATPSEEKSEESTRGPEYSAEAHSTDSDSSPIAESKPSAKPEVNSEPSGTIGPIVRSVPPPASSTFVRPPKAVRPISRAPKSHVPYGLTSTIGAAPHLPRASTILVTVPGRESQPVRVRFPEKTIAATSSLAMTSQLSVLVSPEPAPTVAHRPARLEAGDLVSYGWPSYPRPGDRYRFAETIRVRATIGQLGQVLEVKFLSGSVPLFPATIQAIRQWRYRPTLLDKRPVQAQQDITIEFRPPQYSSQVSTRHPSHN